MCLPHWGQAEIPCSLNPGYAWLWHWLWVLFPSAWSSLAFRFLTLPENKACPAQLTGPSYG